jgi:hypothetical protein
MLEGFEQIASERRRSTKIGDEPINGRALPKKIGAERLAGSPDDRNKIGAF